MGCAPPVVLPRPWCCPAGGPPAGGLPRGRAGAPRASNAEAGSSSRRRRPAGGRGRSL